MSETQLQLQVDDLTDKIEELEEELKRTKLTEKQLRAALSGSDAREAELSAQLENARGDAEVPASRVLLGIQPGRAPINSCTFTMKSVWGARSFYSHAPQHVRLLCCADLSQNVQHHLFL